MKNGLKILLFADSWQVLAIGMITPIYAIFVQKIGGDILDVSWAYFTFMITIGVTVFLISHWEDKVKHKEKLVILGYALTALGCFLYLFVFNQITLLLVQVLLGLAEAVQIPAYDTLYSRFLNIDKASSEWGDWEAMKYITTAIAAITGGVLVDNFGFKALFIAMTLFALMSMFAAMNLFRKKEYLNSKKIL